MPFQKEPPASFGREGRSCALGRSQGFQLRATRQPWYADPGSVPTEPAPTCPREGERPGKGGKGAYSPPPSSPSQLQAPLKSWVRRCGQCWCRGPFSELWALGSSSLSGMQSNINQKVWALDTDKPRSNPGWAMYWVYKPNKKKKLLNFSRPWSSYF